MMWAKGFAAEETKAALARAAELGERTNDFSVRFAVLQGQWAAAGTAGELRSARKLGLTLLREAEDAGRVREARTAHWLLGMAAYWHGDFVEARARCERALAGHVSSSDPGGSGDILTTTGPGRPRSSLRSCGNWARSSAPAN